MCLLAKPATNAYECLLVVFDFNLVETSVDWNIFNKDFTLLYEWRINKCLRIMIIQLIWVHKGQQIIHIISIKFIWIPIAISLPVLA